MKNGITSLNPIIVYTKKDCPSCDMVTSFLISEDAYFVERDATENLDILSKHKVRSLPAITMDNKTFYSSMDIQAIQRLIGGQRNE